MADRKLERPEVHAWAALSSALLFLPCLAGAQETSGDHAITAEEDAQTTEVVITGSRIVNPEYSHASPVVSIGADAIQSSGATNLTDFLKELPALAGSLDANNAAGPAAYIGGTGLNMLNLRNLGFYRTLVLVDGRRHVAAFPGTAAVDTDTIPITLIERVDIETGGASAVYGADGVSGVVNFIMKKDFEGLAFRSQFGQSGQSDAGSVLLSAVGGKNFHEGRGNISAALEFTRENRLKGVDRDFASGGRSARLQSNPDDLSDDPNIPDNVPLRNIRFNDSSRGGAVYADPDDWAALLGTDPDAQLSIDYNGTTPWDSGTIPFVPPYFMQGGSGTTRDDYIGDLTPQEKRYTANVFLNYEFSEKVHGFSELKFSRNDAFSEGAPTFDYFLGLTPDYFYITSDQAARVGAEGLLVSRDNFDLGIRNNDVRRETTRAVAGLKGGLTPHVSYEVSFVYGETDARDYVGNNRFNDRFAAALDAVVDPSTGQATCRSNLNPAAVPFNLEWQGWNGYEPLPGTWAGSFTPGPNSGCVPLNILGDGSISPEAAAWIMTTSLLKSKMTQQVAQAFLSGDFGNALRLPGGSVGYATGIEWRKEASNNVPPAEDRAGLTYGNLILPTHGDYNVKEAYAELNLPLLKDRPFVRSLSLEVAGRLSDYSTTGNGVTWNTGFQWSPMPDVTLRGTLAAATRAPNIGELFDPAGQDFQLIVDPCDVDHVQEGTQYREANCAALLSGLGVDPASYHDVNSSAVSGIQMGNANLEEEKARTKTLGIVLQPRFTPGLSIAIDWYDIDLRNAINLATPQEQADNCVDQPTLDNGFCALLTREAGSGPTAGRIVDFIRQPLNVARFTTRGYDFVVDYRIRAFDLRLVGNKLNDLTFVNLPGADPDRDVGEEDKPDWQMNFDVNWRRGPVRVNYGANYFDATQRFTLLERAGNPDIADRQYLNYKHKLTHDVQLRYDFPNFVGAYVGVNNLTDEKPDVGKTFYPVSAVGRFYYVGVNFRNFGN